MHPYPINPGQYASQVCYIPHFPKDQDATFPLPYCANPFASNRWSTDQTQVTCPGCSLLLHHDNNDKDTNDNA